MHRRLLLVGAVIALAAGAGTGKAATDEALAKTDGDLVARHARSYDTGQTIEDLAHLLDSDSRNPRTLAPSASSRHRIPRDSRNTR